MRVEVAYPDEGSQQTMRARRAHDLTIVKSSRLLNWEMIRSGLSRTHAAIARLGKAHERMGSHPSTFGLRPNSRP